MAGHHLVLLAVLLLATPVLCDVSDLFRNVHQPPTNIRKSTSVSLFSPPATHHDTIARARDEMWPIINYILQTRHGYPTPISHSAQTNFRIVPSILTHAHSQTLVNPAATPHRRTVFVQHPPEVHFVQQRPSVRFTRPPPAATSPPHYQYVQPALPLPTPPPSPPPPPPSVRSVLPTSILPPRFPNVHESLFKSKQVLEQEELGPLPRLDNSELMSVVENENSLYEGGTSYDVPLGSVAGDRF